MLDATERAVRQPGTRVALVVHLSRMGAPGPRPYHRRIARALLEDAAQHLDGQVFALRNADLVLLLRRDAGPALTDTLARLFHIDMPDREALLTTWTMAEDGAALLAYARARSQDRAWEAAAETVGTPTVIDSIETLVHQSRLTDLMQRQTAVVLEPGDGPGIRSLFREITFSVAVLEARIAAVGQAEADPFLFRHLASRLDRRLLEALRQDLGGAGPMTAGTGKASATALHLNLTVSGILSGDFAAVAAACRVLGAPMAVEVPLLEVCGDPDGFARARDRVRLAGMGLVLDGVSVHALLLTNLEALQPDLVKLEWSPRLPEHGPAVSAALAAIGLDRVVLHRAETEAAMSWGMTHGIRRFQGRHVDAVLAAARIAACDLGRGCAVRQCVERAASLDPAGRVGCFDTAMLDATAPVQVMS